MDSVLRLTDEQGVARLRCGRQRGGAGRRQVRQDQFAVNYLVVGTGTYRDDRSGQTWHLGPGDLFMRLPQQPHTVTLEDAPPPDVFFLAVPAEVYSLLRMSHLLPAEHRLVCRPGLSPSCAEGFQALARHMARQPEPELSSSLVEAQALLCRLLTTGLRKEGNSRAEDLLTRACRRLDGDLASRTPLPALAAELGTSYSHFRQLFRQRLGASPAQYRIHRRIERAQALLTGTDRSIKSIAAQLGYPEVFTFSRQFKQVTGTPPATYRQQALG